MNMLKFKTLDSFYSFLQQDILSWNEYGRNESGTGDEYKKILKETNQIYYEIEDAQKVLTNFKSLKQYAWWACGECLTEILADTIPLMDRYAPEVIEWSYKPTLTGEIEYMYGVRWNNFRQLHNTINTLIKRQDSKRAVMTIFEGQDTDPNRKDVPCTTQYMFNIRDNTINMTVFYRSHDLFAGHKYDVILSSFMLQVIAMAVSAEIGQELQIGKLSIYENSLHTYPYKDEQKYQQFISEQPYANENSFNIMHKYSSAKNVFKDLRRVSKAEYASYFGNFVASKEIIDKIENPAFRDIARVFYNRNRKHLKSDVNAEEYETTILTW